jgi:hypothetical protein
MSEQAPKLLSGGNAQIPKGEGDRIDEATLKALIRSAVALNLAKGRR